VDREQRLQDGFDRRLAAAGRDHPAGQAITHPAAVVGTGLVVGGLGGLVGLGGRDGRSRSAGRCPLGRLGPLGGLGADGRQR
jgi:hypothetical protein